MLLRVEPHGLFSWLSLDFSHLLPLFALHPSVSAIPRERGVLFCAAFAHQMRN